MPRAFLSHSSQDKAFVEEVAKRLGAARSQIDSQAFRPGEDFREAIRRTLVASDVFVLFASKASLRSTWVRFEIDEAELGRMRSSLRRSVVIFLDGPVDASTLPEWMRRMKAVQHHSPGQSTRLVESLLLSANPSSANPFVGRHDDLQRGERKLSVEPWPRLVVVSGLEGVGRRSYARKLFGQVLDADLGPLIVLPATATLEDIYIQCRVAATLLDRMEVEAELFAFRALSSREQSTEVAGQLVYLSNQGSVPCIVDGGSLLRGTGEYVADIETLLQDFVEADARAFLCLVHRRRPELRSARFKEDAFTRHLGVLDDPDMQVLLRRLLQNASEDPRDVFLERLTEAASGFPPAAYFIASQVEVYGAEAVAADAKRLNDFYSHSFARFLQDLDLPEVERTVLTYLASETQLSLSGVATAIGQSIERVAGALTLLVDLCVIERADDEFYVSAPIQRTVLRANQTLGSAFYEEAFGRLEEEYWSDERSMPPIGVVDATLRAAFRFGRTAAEGYSALVRPSILIAAAQEKYHQRDYAEALLYLERAEQMRATSEVLLELRVKCYAQMRRFAEARSALKEYKSTGDRRQWYLQGFVERKALNHDRAVAAFQRGYGAGDKAISLLRDYGDSMFRLEGFSEALGLANEALVRDAANIYLLDLVARVEIVAGSLEAAERALETLEQADVEERVCLFRRAAFLLDRRGNAESVRRALALVERAVEKRDAPVEAHVIHARALAKLKRWDEYEETKGVIRRKGRNGDVLRRLDLDAAIADGDWRRAERLLNGSTTSEERLSKAAVLDLKSTDFAVPLPDRKEAATQAARERDEATAPVLVFGPPIDDTYE